MSLQIITGSSGAGKTERLYRTIIELSIARPEGRFFVIVPEQATMQAQKEIVRLHPNHGTLNIDILSFQRLAYRVFSELSIKQPQVLDDCGKTMVLRKLAGERKKELPMFAAHLHQAGFIDELKSLISEFYQYEVTPAVLGEELLKVEDDPVLYRKLKDMSTLYQAFQDYTRERFITIEEILDVLCHELSRSGLVRDSVVAFDGFTGFTPVQYRLIGLLLKQCRRIYATVTIPASEDLYGPGRESDLFDMSRKMAGKLKNLAEESQVVKQADIALCGSPLPRFEKCSALDFLERELYRYPYRSYRKKPEGISLVQAENPSDEVDFVVNTVHQLVREQGYRYREIAVVCGDLPDYSNELLHQFEENGIPIFLDEKKTIMGNPFIRLIRSSLEIIRGGFSYEDMFQYLRTGLVSREEEKIDRMENYVRALGIRGFKRWDAPWERVYEGAERINLEELNAFREELMGPLRILREEMRGNTEEDAAAGREAKGSGQTVGGMTKALVHLFLTLHVEEQLAEQSRAFLAAGEHGLSREFEQIYPLVLDLFERLTVLLGGEAVARREYGDILNAGFSQISVGMIPACADRVVAGDLKRTRLDGIRALFFVGVNDGIVPADTDKGGILTEQEREQLKRHDLELAPSAREEGFMQRFYLYLTLAKPGERLYLSYCAMSAAGKSMRPSSLIGQLRKRFPELCTERTADKKRSDISIPAAKKAVIRGLSEPEQSLEDESFGQFYRWLSGQADCAKEMELLAKACSYSYQERGIGREAAKELYGQILNGSVTRLEGYAACAYAHFLNYGLELKKRKEYELELSDMGNLFHRSIDLFFREVREQGRDFRTLSKEEQKTLVKHCVGQVAEEYGNTIMKSSARNTYLEQKVERITDKTVGALVKQIRKGDFEPEEFEVEISRQIPISGEESLNLRGRIDRVDTYEDEEKIYVKIMDYKSGSTSFDLALLYHGLQMQLAVYMDAALAMQKSRRPEKEAVPAGIFYYHIDDPVVERREGMTPEEIEAEALRKLRMNGLVNSNLDVIRHLDREIETESDVIPVAVKDGIVQESKSSVAGGRRFEALAGYVNRTLASMGREILDGETKINPYKQGIRTACDYCPYHSVCGFDQKTGGFGFRKFRAMKPEEIWERIEGDEKGGRD